MAASVGGDNDGISCTSGDDWAVSPTHSELGAVWFGTFCLIYHFQLQPPSFSCSHSFSASPAHKTLLQMNLEDSSDLSETTVVTEMS